MGASTVEQAYELAVRHHRSGQLREAEAVYRQVLSVLPNPYVYNNLADVLASLGRREEAVTAFRQALSLRPEFPEAIYNLANVLHESGRLQEAIAAYREALRMRPDFVEARNNLANILGTLDRSEEAVEEYHRALAVKSDTVSTWFNLGNALQRLGRMDEAVDAYQSALQLDPKLVQGIGGLIGALGKSGRLDDVIAACRQALAIEPADSNMHSKLLWSIWFHPDYDSRAILREHQQWERRHAAPLRGSIRPHDNDRTPDRRLKIGYLSPDFKWHCLALFIVPLLSNHDRTQFEIFCYSNVGKPDAMTARIQGYADHWRDISKLNDTQAAELVRADGIDLLIDLTLHMDWARPLIFARKPAPVQVTWFGYPGTTGLTTIDYRLSDPYLDPDKGDIPNFPINRNVPFIGSDSTSSPQATPADEQLYSEKTVRLPHTFWCYDPLTPIPQSQISKLKSEIGGPQAPFTFGCLNNFLKVTAPTLELWARVLCAMPESRLLILAPRGSARPRTTDALAKHGVDPARIQFVDFQPREQYLQTYNQIDLCLDTIPYPGHTTTIDALWMGVPTVTLPGRTSVSRGGVSILTNAGLLDFIARDADDYVRIASELAPDLPRLAALRSTLRQRLEASPLMDAPRFARDFESALRTMWRTWCQTGVAK